MKETTQQLLNRAVDTIEAADILLTNGKAEIAAGRAYYAMFYVAEALLNGLSCFTASPQIHFLRLAHRHRGNRIQMRSAG